MSLYSTPAVSRPPASWKLNRYNPVRALASLVLVIFMSAATPASAAVKPTAYAEFVKALNIIEQTQLTLFTEETPPTRQEIINDYNRRVEAIESELDKQADDYQETAEAARIDIMREILSETIEFYNDQYANYIYPEALKRYNSRRNGNFVGIGLKFRAITDDYPIVIGPLANGPMDGKNILPGDHLISIDDKLLKGLTSSEVVAALKGPKESTGHLTVRRNKDNHQIAVKRAAVELHYTDSELLNNKTGYIKISRFGSKTHTRVEKLLRELLSQGAESFILDLRDNPGGSTRAARAIVSMFSTEKNMYCERYKTGAIKQLPRHGEHLTDKPLAVLINGDSMSSSEIVAGAIQAYERGIIIGTRSFGKGLVQKVFNLAEPLGGAVRTTIAMFGRPDHEMIHENGIVPDVTVETDSDFMFRRTGSLNINDNARAYQRTLLEQDVREKHPDKADEFIAAKDIQLHTALERLQQSMATAQ